ncbi:MAG: class I SAM-dependent methyltransferase [Nitrospirae bacterium]|nr:MAG: class I SAM-dependent methyltransferase [Nitrospirota bacterium]
MPTHHNDQARLAQYLASWGLRQFPDAAAYEQWQREQIPAHERQRLDRLRQERGESIQAERAFYDLAAHPQILPALHSQHYDYYMTVGSTMADRIAPACRVLDVGCGVGILTIYYASLFPETEFVGIDRSPVSIATASAEARKRHVRNVRFELTDLSEWRPDSLRFDLVLSTHAVFQAEHDPGMPSRSWRTFDRAADCDHQHVLEERTGLKTRLDALCRLLDAKGRLLLCEKATHLGRRVLLQRALSARGLSLYTKPFLIRYHSLGELIDDGPLYEVSYAPTSRWEWDEQWEPREGDSLYCVSGAQARQIGQRLCRLFPHRTVDADAQRFGRCRLTVGTWENALHFCYVSNVHDVESVVIGAAIDAPLFARLLSQWERRTASDRAELIAWLSQRTVPATAEEPLPWYENHTPVAQWIWEALPDKIVHREHTFQEHDGRQLHVETGASLEWAYLYWANTFDQRQLVIVPVDQDALLHHYLDEAIADMPMPAKPRS